MKRILIIMAFTCFAVGSLYAQGFTALHYDLGLPMGSTADAVGGISFRGVGLDFKQSVTDNVSIGGSFAWQVFYERKDNATYTDGTTSISGIQYSYINAVPLLLTFDYYFAAEDEAVRPFIGLGVGTLSFNRRVDMGVYTSSINTWMFAVQPEVGLLYEMSSNANLFVAAKYMNGFKNSEADSQSYLGLNFGVAWKFQ